MRRSPIGVRKSTPEGYFTLILLAFAADPSTVDHMICHTWDHLYEQYETAALKRVQKKKGSGFVANRSELDRLNTKITEALHQLREHEKQHQCR